MIDHYIDNNTRKTAEDIATPLLSDDVYEAQTCYWFHLRHLIRAYGFTEARKQHPFLTECLATALEKANSNMILKLCLTSISTIKPALSDQSIIESLRSDHNSGSSKTLLQILSGQTLSLESA